MSDDVEDRICAIEVKVSQLGVLTKRAMDAIRTLEDCQLVRLSPEQPRMTPEGTLCFKVNPETGNACYEVRHRSGAHMDSAGRTWVDAPEPDASQVVFHCPTHDKFVTNGADDRDFCPWCQIDKLESLLSPESDPTPEPYRMAEPTKIGASVISDGTVFTRTDNSDTPWRQHHDLGLAPLRWDWIRSPQPYQNCVLTADDPEPPNGSIVMGGRGDVWRYSGGYWVSNVYFDCWQDMGDFGPFTLLYRGEA